MTIPQNIIDKLNEDSARKEFRVVFADGSLPDIINADIVQENVSFTESVCSQNELKLGLCESPYIEFEAVNLPNIKGKEIIVYLEIYCDEDTEGAVYRSDTEAFVYPILYGKFKVDDCLRETDKTKRKVEAYGRTAYEDWKPDNNRMIYPTDLDGFIAVAIQSDELLKGKHYHSMESSFVTSSSSNVVLEESTQSGNIEHTIVANTILEKLSDTYSEEDSEFLRIRWRVMPGYPEKEFETVKYIQHDTPSSYEETSFQGVQFSIIPSDLYVDEISGVTYPENPMLFSNKLMKEVSAGAELNSFIQDCNSYFEENRVIEFTYTHINKILSIKSTEAPNILSTISGMFYRNFNSSSLNGLNIGIGRLNCLFAETYRLRPMGASPSGFYGYEISVKKDDDTYYSVMFPFNQSIPTLNDLYERIKDRTDMNGALAEITQRNRVISSFTKEIELHDIDVIDYEHSAITVTAPTQFTTEELQKRVSAELELDGKVGKFLRDGSFTKLNLSGSLGTLFPSKELLPGDDLLPSGANGGNIELPNYSKCWFDDEQTKAYGRIMLTYKDSTTHNNTEVVLDLVDDYDANPDNYLLYEVEDNFLLENNEYTEAEALQFLQNIADGLSNVQYMPVEINMKGRPDLECGDAIQINTNEGAITTIILERTIKGVQFLEDSIKSE